MRSIESYHEIELTRENLRQKLEKNEQQIYSQSSKLLSISHQDITRLIVRKSITMAIQYLFFSRKKRRNKKK